MLEIRMYGRLTTIMNDPLRNGAHRMSPALRVRGAETELLGLQASGHKTASHKPSG